MFVVRDKKIPNLTHWFALNRMARGETLQDYFATKFNQVNKAVIQDRLGIIIFDHKLDHKKDNYKEVGMLIPASLFYQYAIARREIGDDYPLVHVELEKFQQNSRRYLRRVNCGYNLLLLDRGQPVIVFANEYSHFNLKISDRKGHVVFDESSEIAPEIEPELWGLKEFAELTGEIENEERSASDPSISKKDALILQRTLEALGKIYSPSPERVEQAVARLRIYPGNCLVRRGSQPADQPAYEAG